MGTTEERASQIAPHVEKVHKVAIERIDMPFAELVFFLAKFYGAALIASIPYAIGFLFLFFVLAVIGVSAIGD